MMKCTSCKSGELVRTFIDGLFEAKVCDNCGGNWILVEDYVEWKTKNPEHQFDVNESFEVSETTTAMLCPVSGIIMRKLKMGENSQHRVDYSAAVGGVWLDKGEWELLKAQGLAGSLNNVLTAVWQRNIQLNTTHKNLAEVYKSKFGNEDYEKVKAFREWLSEKPNKADLKAYINAEDPYSAIK
jgi:Zn-finger nucleic acid-binding protein